MFWDLVREWGALLLAAAVAGERIAAWVLRAKFATTDTVLTVHQAVRDEQIEQDVRINGAFHRIELLEERLKGYPGYSQFNEIKDDVADLKRGQAVGDAKLDTMKESLDLLRVGVERLGDEFRNKGR